MKEYSACTTILVGKNASIDGTAMIARNDDTFRPITPQKFIIEPLEDTNITSSIQDLLNNISNRKELTMIDRKCKFQYSGRNGNKCMEASYD